jgi:Leucine-rich repeat (LRR) protein
MNELPNHLHVYFAELLSGTPEHVQSMISWAQSNIEYNKLLRPELQKVVDATINRLCITMEPLEDDDSDDSSYSSESSSDPELVSCLRTDRIGEWIVILPFLDWYSYKRNIYFIRITNSLSSITLSDWDSLVDLGISHQNSDCKITITRCPKLNRLLAVESDLTITPHVTECCALWYLNFGKNQLTNPPDVRGFTELRHLILNNNQLVDPPDLRACEQLKLLSLAHNRLTAAPMLDECPSLVDLNISHNSLEWPPRVCYCENLRELHLDHNKLIEAPDVSNCQTLKWLYLSHNDLTESPDVSECIWLETWDMSYNRLTSRPDRSMVGTGCEVLFDGYARPCATLTL